MLPNIIKIYAKSDFMIQWQLADGYDGQEFKFTLFTNEEIENGWVASYIDGHYTNCTVEDDKVNIYVDSTHTIKAGCLTIQSEYDYNNTHFADNVETIKDSVKTNIYLVMSGANATSASFVPSNLPDLSGTNDYVTWSDMAYFSYVSSDELSSMGYITASDVEQMGYATESYVAEYVATHTADIDMSSYVTKVELNAAGYATTTQLMFKQDALSSGVNIKTINNQSILGSGNLNVVTDLDGYATEAYVQAKIDAIPQTDMSSYVTKSELDAAGYISSIPSEYITQSELSENGYLTSVPSNYATKTYVVNYVEEFATAGIDLSRYVTKTQLNNAGYISSIPAEYITQEELSSNGYLTAVPSQYITDAELDAMGYVTNSQLSNYATKTYVQQYIDANVPDMPDMNNYVTKNELSLASYATTTQLMFKQDALVSGTSIKTINNQSLLGSGNINVLTSVPDEYATKSYVTQQIASIPQADMSAYVTKTELDNAGYISSIPSEYITQSELSANAYLTEHQSLDAYATKAYVNEKISQIPGADLSAYVTKAELSAAGYLDSVPAEYITQTELSANGYLTAIPAQYITQTQLSSNGYLTSVPSNYATKAYVENYVNENMPYVPDMNNYVTKQQLNNAGYITNSALNGYATETYVANYVATHSGSGGGNVVECTQAQYDTWAQAGTLDPDTIYIITDADPINLSYYVMHSELESMGYATEAYVQNKINSIPSVDLSAYVTKTELSNAGYITMSDVSACGYITSIPSEYITESELNGMGYATNSEVQNILSNSGYVTSNELSNAGYITNNDLQQTLSNAGYLTSIPSEYITETELNGMGYATEAYVQSKIESIPSVDLSSYVTYNFLSSQSYLQSIPSEYITESELNGMGYATEAYVQNKINSIPSVDMSAYVTKTELNNAGYLTSIPSEYITETELNGMGYATEAYVQNKINSIPSVDLSSYVTHTELSNAGYLTSIPSEYITETELNGMGYITQSVLNAAGYATTTYVANYVATYGGGGQLPDMSAYVTHTELNAAAYITQSQLSSNSYITQSQLSSNSYVTQTDLNEKLGDLSYAQVVEISYADYNNLSYAEQHDGSIYVLTDRQYDFDPSYYVTHIELNNAAYTTEAYVRNYVDTYAPTVDLSAYVTKTELNNAAYITAAYVDSKGYAKSYTLTQSEYDALIQGGTYDPTTIYIISDAAPVDLSYYVLISYLETYYYSKSYVDSNFVSKSYLSSCGYLTQDNFEYDSVNNTLTIRI